MTRPLTIEGNPDRNRKALIFAQIATLQLVLLTLLGMLLYAGGNRPDPTAESYNFFVNFFSDLGLTVAINGEPNTASMILFVLTTMIGGLGIILFFIVWPRFFWNRSAARILALIGSFFGIGAGLGFIGVGLTPWDQLPAQHENAVYMAFVSLMMSAVFYTIAIFLRKGYPNGYGWEYLVFAIMLAGYVWLLFYGPDTATTQGRLIQVIGQKLIVYAGIISIFVQATGARRLLSGSAGFSSAETPS